MKLAVCVFLLLAACNFPTAGAEESTQARETIQATVAASNTAIASTPGQPPESKPTIYNLTATLDYASHYLAVTEEIIYTNNSSTALNEIFLVVEADHQGALFELDAIDNDRGSAWDYGTNQHIQVAMARPLAPGEQVTLTLTYALTLPQRASTLGWTERQTNFVDWYPYIPPYIDGQGWLVNQPTTQGEYLAYESADFYVSIYTRNTPALFHIAAPAPEVEIDGGRSYTLLNARRFAWTASGHFKTATQTAGAADSPITIYFYEEERDAAEAALQTAAQAIEIYEDLYGPFSYESLAIVECSFPDGMESDGLFYLDMEYFRKYSYNARNLLTTLIAHETAHSWWYGAVGNDPANEPWLDEALATYSELLYYERAHPADVAWWWEFRVDQWNPAGWVDSTAYELPTFRPYVNAVYLRGAQFLDELRDLLGDEAFFAFMRDYSQQGANRLVTSEEFLWKLAYAAPSKNQELNTVLNKYFRLTD